VGQRISQLPQKSADFDNEMLNDKYAKTKAASLLRSNEEKG
jgi:hypothetical protein